MERVQYSLESALPELKDLQENGIFSPEEIREIIKRRTHYETQLIRRQPRKKDFLEYVEYEMALERLRKKRVQRLKTPLPHSISSHSLVQRQFSILERATRKFKGDLRLWVQYIEIAKREKAGNLVGRIVAKALKLHPTSAALYVLAAQYEVDRGLPSAARNIFHRGIRLNDSNVELWCEYVKMELGWCEGLRRRWETLGIDPALANLSAAENAEIEGSAKQSTEAARKEVLQGAIVKQVLRDALKAISTLKLFNSLAETLKTYPTKLAASLVPFLYDLLQDIPAFSDAGRGDVITAYALRHLCKANLRDKDLVDALRLSNEEIQAALATELQSGNTKTVHELEVAYSVFVWTQWTNLLDPHLRLYLSSSLHNMCTKALKRTVTDSGGVALFTTHLRILLDPTHPPPAPDPERILKMARKYSITSTSAEIWRARLEAEEKCQTDTLNKSNEIKRVALAARRACKGANLEQVWCWGWDNLDLSEQEDILKQALSQSETLSLREHILMQTLSSLYLTQPQNKSEVILRLLRTYSPGTAVYEHAFELEKSEPSSSTNLLRSIFHLWRDAHNESGSTESTREDATLAFASYLLHNGSVKEANSIISNLVAASGARREGIERRWKQVIDGPRIDQVEREDGAEDAMETDEDSESELLVVS
ncbi:U3 small nucleolar RNA-associated protein 6 Short=U3 snoRNA-associated protein 6 [Serendipita indica DSM 11827]|nr:U3 small nucleolar RNA-associated protein 6 Short=U3 snoRNA-associated protein 6 [Serendipita indica DSM 11827]